jgi:hypothetical protein
MTPDRWFTVWFTLAGLVIGGLLTWFWSRYYYHRADRRRIPTFVVGKNQKVLCSPELFKVEGIKILDRDKPKQPTYIRELLIYFWNSGTLAIQKSEILEPFSIHLAGPLLQYKVLKISRPVVGFWVEELVGDLILDFTVLEPNDGATISIVYEGNEEATPEFKGTCLEVAKPTVLAPADFYTHSRRQRIMNSPLFTLPMIGIVGLAILGSGKGLIWLANRFPWLHLDAIGVALLWLLLTSLAGAFLLGVLTSISDGVKKLRMAYIPPEIKP